MPDPINTFGVRPLIELKTNLTSLKYGGDRLGNGWSGQPYIQTPINPNQRTPNQRNLISLIRNSTDFPIRGGAIDYNPQTQTISAFGELDKRRIKAFLESKPRGSAFIQKQIGLQLSNPNIQTGQALFSIDRIFGVTFPSFTKNTKIYNNGKNTLAQVGFSGTGIHAVRHGILPIDIKTKYYSDIVGAELRLDQNTVQGKNRLLILNNLKMTSGSSFTPLASTNINEINNLGISRNKLVLFDYLTGPGSVYGIGKTTIRRYDDTRQAGLDWANDAGAIRTYELAQNKQLGHVYSTAALTYDAIITKTQTKPGNFSKIAILNDREQIYAMNLRNRKGSDQINLTNAITKIKDDPWPNANPDMIKFGFECMSNDIPGESVFLQFRAYLNGGITDNNGATWNSFKYMGRGEDFFTYQGFNRSISFNFSIAAQSEEEMKPIYNKLNYLISQTYPDYSPTTNMMRGPLVKLTIGDYLYRQPGFLESVNITVDQTSPWEINYNQVKNGTVEQLPQVLNVAIAFKPIFNELPRRSTGDKNATTIIGNKIIDKQQPITIAPIDKKDLSVNVPNLVGQFNLPEDIAKYEKNRIDALTKANSKKPYIPKKKTEYKPAGPAYGQGLYNQEKKPIVEEKRKSSYYGGGNGYYGG